MNDKIKEYRAKRKKCKWCKYFKWNSMQQCHWITCYGECLIKDKIINFDSMLRICKYYELKDNEEK